VGHRQSGCGRNLPLHTAVKAILEVDTPRSQLLRHFLDFTEAILAPDPAGIDRVVSLDARFYELEAIGYPRGPEGFKMFRRQVNAAIPDEHIFIIAVRFEGDDIIEADLDIRATHTGEEMMGAPATGRKIRFGVHARDRFVGGKMAERGTAPTSRISSASSRDPLSRPQSNTLPGQSAIDLNYAEPWIAPEFLMYHSVRGGAFRNP
jgi:predicted ester cyclase